MNTFWDSLPLPWQVCLEEAWLAYAAGCIPIGAVITAPDGAIISRGRNRINDPFVQEGFIHNNKLAHAELNALIVLPEGVYDLHTCTLYTLLEPCPLCLGALYMSGVRNLFYAAYDPWAGSANLLGATPYLSRKPVRAVGPSNPDLEQIVIAIQVVSGFQGVPAGMEQVLETWRAVFPQFVAFGERVFAAQVLPQFSAKKLLVSDLINYLFSLLCESKYPVSDYEIIGDQQV
jgi:tRNA(Arg) A34 adenosine deaminase TadA